MVWLMVGTSFGSRGSGCNAAAKTVFLVYKSGVISRSLNALSFFIVMFLIGASGCTRKDGPHIGSGVSRIRVLTYSSFLGEKSLGGWLKSEYEKTHPGTEILFIEAQNESGIVGELKRTRPEGEGIDIVFGLDDVALKRIGPENFVQLKKISSSPMTILIHKARAPKALAKRSYHFATWRELIDSGVLKGTLLVQDPRFSSPGFSWLTQSHSVKGVNAKQMHSLVRRVFPSWSASFGAIESGESFAIWTYASSLSYYECQKSENPYTSLVVDEGFVEASETVGLLKKAPDMAAAHVLMDFLLSERFQQKMVELNWVYPVSNTPLPSCFLPKSKFPILEKTPEASVSEINGWMDEWQLF